MQRRTRWLASQPRAHVRRRGATTVLMLIIISFLGSSIGFGSQSVNVPAGANATLSGITGYTDYVGPLRLEARFHGCSIQPPSAYVSLLNIGVIDLRIVKGKTVIEGTYWGELGTSGHPQVDLSGLDDFVIRAQRDPGKKLTSLEVWNPASGTHAVQTKPVTTFRPRTLSTVQVGSTALSLPCSVAFIRVSDTLVPLGSVPPIAFASGGNIVDLEFEGNGTDAVVPQSMKYSSQISYSATPVYAPVCNVGNTNTFRAGAAMRLDGTRSYTSDGSSVTYFWEIISAPPTARLNWSSYTSATPVVTGTVFGTHIFRLNVFDAGGRRSHCTVTHGAVVTDANGVVITGNPALDLIIGPMIRWGSYTTGDSNPNPYPWMDERHKSLADYFGSLQGTAHPTTWLNALPGTVTVSNTTLSTKVYGNGTSFRRDFCGGENTPPKAVFPVVWYTLPTGEQGRYIGVNNGSFVAVKSCDSDTELTLDRPWYNQGTSEAKYSLITLSELGLWHTADSSINYYDNVLAYYAMYYRSGLEKYREHARWLADRWVTYPSVNWGYRTAPYGSPGSSLPPRKGASIGILLRALDGKPEYMAVFRRQISAWRGNLINPYNPVGEREYAYRLIDTALCALFDTGPGGEAAACRADIVNSFNRRNGWKNLQRANGIWEVALNGFGAGTVTVETGSRIVVGTGTSFVTGKFPLWFCNADCKSNDDGDSRAYVGYTVDSPTQITLAAPYEGISGSGKRWMAGPSYRSVGWGTQPYMMGIVGTAMYYSWKALLEHYPGEAEWARSTMNRIADWLINVGYSPDSRGLYYARGFPNCEPDPNRSDGSQGDCLSSSPAASRGLTSEVTRVLCESYLDRRRTQPTTATTLKARGDTMIAATWLKPGTERAQGPLSDGLYWSYNMESLNADSAKWMGFPFGMGFSACWPAARLGGVNALPSLF